MLLDHPPGRRCQGRVGVAVTLSWWRSLFLFRALSRGRCDLVASALTVKRNVHCASDHRSLSLAARPSPSSSQERSLKLCPLAGACTGAPSLSSPTVYQTDSESTLTARRLSLFAAPACS